MAINTLFDSFNQFKVDHELHMKQHTLASLMKDLQITKGILKKKRIIVDANVAEADSSKAKPKGKAKKNKDSKALVPNKKKMKKNVQKPKL